MLLIFLQSIFFTNCHQGRMFLPNYKKIITLNGKVFASAIISFYPLRGFPVFPIIYFSCSLRIHNEAVNIRQFALAAFVSTYSHHRDAIGSSSHYNAFLAIMLVKIILKFSSSYGFACSLERETGHLTARIQARKIKTLCILLQVANYLHNTQDRTYVI